MKKIFAVLLAAAALICLSITASAAVHLNDGVSILNPQKNIHGQGYEWDNIHDTLTLNNLYIDTTDEYGMKLPDGATVILKGTNYIKASSYALYLGGKVQFKGNGKLILEGETGVFCNSSDKTDNVSIISGKYEIKASKTGIRSAVQDIYLTGAEMKISAGEIAADVHSLSVADGMKLTADAPLRTAYLLAVEACDVTVDAGSKGPALYSAGRLTVDRVDVALSASSSLSHNEYDGGSYIRTKSNWKYMKSSIIFGENVSFAVDVILFVLLIGVIAALILLPKYFKKKKLEKILKEKM